MTCRGWGEEVGKCKAQAMGRYYLCHKCNAAKLREIARKVKDARRGQDPGTDRGGPSEGGKP